MATLSSTFLIRVSASSARLKPFTSYQFRVKATNDIGDSEYSEDSEAITTLQDGEHRGILRMLLVHGGVGQQREAWKRKLFSSRLLFF